MEQLKEKLKNEILPAIKVMIEKEKSHISYLKSKNAHIDTINESEWFLNHYEQRYNEYTELI